MRFTQYDPEGFFDEMFGDERRPRPAARALAQFIDALPDGELLSRQRSAERALLTLGITFNVYGDGAGTERIFPFDLVPRIVSASEWRTIERGLKQRIEALNLFLDDIYHDQRIIKDGVVPCDVIRSARAFRPQCVGLEAAARHLVSYHGHRSGAARRWPDLRARGQPAVSVGRVVRAREPQRDEADVPARVRVLADPAGARLPRAASAKRSNISRPPVSTRRVSWC